jgi:hypothetical protein
MVSILPHFFKNKYEKIIEHFALNLPSTFFVPEDSLDSVNNGCVF